MLRTYQPKKDKEKRAWLQERMSTSNGRKVLPSSCKGTQAFDRIAGNSENTVSLNQNTLFKKLYYRGRTQHSSL